MVFVIVINCVNIFINLRGWDRLEKIGQILAINGYIS